MNDDPYWNETTCPECGCICSVFDEICDNCQIENEAADENLFL